ncbi:lipoprotein [Altererythrobacter aquiaggeris]|uniref:lipoprotein n=1 Tax=Aestuarierythrobacter aquiaggeris TaxID=1898396 RepID=UPI00301AD1A8
MRYLALVVVAASLSACGQKSDLKPVEGRSLPPAAYGEARPASADELLEPDTLAVPERSVELRKRSEEREDDPFDLPPE